MLSGNELKRGMIVAIEYVCVCVVATWDGTVNKKEEKGDRSE